MQLWQYKHNYRNNMLNIFSGTVATAAIATAMKVVNDAKEKRKEEEDQSYQQALAQAEVLNQQEADKKAQQWLDGQAILNAYITELEQKGATPEQIAALREQGSTQGFGTALNTAASMNAWFEQQKINNDRADEEFEEQWNQDRRDHSLETMSDVINDNAAQQAYQTYRDGEYESVAGEESSILEKTLNWVTSPATWWGIGTDKESVDILKKGKDIPFYLPIFKGLGSEYMQDFVTPLKAILLDGKTIRALGRTIGDISFPILMPLGFVITIAPNIYDNIKNNRGLNRITADIMIDGFGFVVSEVAGLGAGTLAGFLSGGNPLAIIPAKLGTDFGTSYLYDDWVDDNGFREGLANILGYKFPTNVTPIPNPTPTIDTTITQTSTPQAQVSESNIDIPVSIPVPTSVPPTPSVTETPKP